MSEDLTFRVAFAVILAVTVFISGYHRSQARRAGGGSIPRRAEGSRLLLLRLVFALPLLALVILYVVDPPWMAWSRVDLPDWMRWSAVALAAATIPFTFWVFRSLART